MRKFAIGLAVMLVAGTAIAGRVGGPMSNRDTVLAYSSDTYSVTFQGRETAQILVAGDGSSDLDCAAYDNNGNLVALDNDSTDTCLLLWMPAWTGKFRVVVRNMGDTDNEYSIRSN